MGGWTLLRGLLCVRMLGCGCRHACAGWGGELQRDDAWANAFATRMTALEACTTTSCGAAAPALLWGAAGAGEHQCQRHGQWLESISTPCLGPCALTGQCTHTSPDNLTPSLHTLSWLPSAVQDAITAICRRGFDVKKADPGGLLGAGVYAAETASYSDSESLHVCVWSGLVLFGVGWWGGVGWGGANVHLLMQYYWGGPVCTLANGGPARPEQLERLCMQLCDDVLRCRHVLGVRCAQGVRRVEVPRFASFALPIDFSRKISAANLMGAPLMPLFGGFFGGRGGGFGLGGGWPGFMGGGGGRGGPWGGIMPGPGGGQAGRPSLLGALTAFGSGAGSAGGGAGWGSSKRRRDEDEEEEEENEFDEDGEPVRKRPRRSAPAPRASPRFEPNGVAMMLCYVSAGRRCPTMLAGHMHVRMCAHACMRSHACMQRVPHSSFLQQCQVPTRAPSVRLAELSLTCKCTAPNCDPTPPHPHPQVALGTCVEMPGGGRPMGYHHHSSSVGSGTGQGIYAVYTSYQVNWCVGAWLGVGGWGVGGLGWGSARWVCCACRGATGVCWHGARCSFSCSTAIL